MVVINGDGVSRYFSSPRSNSGGESLMVVMMLSSVDFSEMPISGVDGMMLM